MKKWIVTILAVALCAAAMAQRGGGMFFGRGGGNPGQLLGRHDVQKELNLSDDQKTKIEAIRQKQREDMQAFRQANAPADGGQPDFTKLRAEMEKMQKEQQKEFDAILTPDQGKRLKEISIQLGGNGAIMRPEVQTDLGLTDEQKGKIKDLQDKQQAAMQEIREKMQNGELDREQMRPLMEKNRKIMDDELGKILTDAQKAKLKELGGKPFTQEPDDNGGVL
jgi:Spy/CpxP family protein refolding chaperone